MNKSAIKNFSVNARRKLIDDVCQMAYNIGIDEKNMPESEKFSDGYKIEVNGQAVYITSTQNEQRETLIAQIKEKGYKQVMEEVAYTWFNRIIAIRFMEVNDYLPSGIRILSSVDKTRVEPDAIREVRSLIDEIKLDADTVYKFQDENDTDGLFKYILIKQCNELNKIMPVMFDKINDYTEILLPDKLLGENSVVTNLANDIDEEDFKEQVEIIGWMYQYYISEKKDEVFADLKKNKKITKENIPAATQLFTPDWIVKYMVENSLGRLWLEGHPDEDLQSTWKYYLEEAKQEPEVEKELEKIKEESKKLNPEDITVLDPSMGSGHILVYAFDVLYQIYESAGYSDRDIPRLILENNIYGLDIDDRAGQLAYFALMMKARSKYRRFFRDVERNPISLNVCSIQESNGLTKEDIEYFANGDESVKKDLEYLVEVFTDAKEYGSILEVKEVDFERLEKRLKQIEEETYSLLNKNSRGQIFNKIPNLIMQGIIINGKYDVCVTNPPYMGNRGINQKLRDFINTEYNDVKLDIYSVFIDRCYKLCKENGHFGFMTPFTWMFISAYESMRNKIIKEKTITSLIQLEYSGFADATVPICTFTLTNRKLNKEGIYIKLSDFKGWEIQPIKVLEAKENPNVDYRYTLNQNKLTCIPGSPIAFWVSDNFRRIFNNNRFYDYTISNGQNKTSDNNKYLRKHWEVKKGDIGKENKWLLYAKGGGYRKWKGNMEDIINWSDEARHFYKTDYSARILTEELWYKKGITWGLITSKLNSFRILEENETFDMGGPTVFFYEYDKFEYFLGFLNSKVCEYITSILNPTLNFQIKDIRNLPIVIPSKEKLDRLKALVNELIFIYENDWNSIENSIEYRCDKILTNREKHKKIENIYDEFYIKKKQEIEYAKKIEQDINKEFIDIYELNTDLTKEIDESEVSLIKPDRNKDIKSFISYAVGCMLGRYSLDVDGLAFAGGEFDESKYNTFKVDTDGIIPITDKEYFEDDIVTKFVEFVKVVFGQESLEENLEYIANTECFKRKKGETARNTLRRYFLKGFIEDHIKTYQKRPIYWMFDSGKQNGFRALMYMHRYNEGTVAKVRTDYLHELQRKYEQEISILDVTINSEVASAKEKADAKKEKQRVQKQIAECIDYDSVVAHVANQKVNIDLDDGVKVNYSKFNNSGEGDLLFKIKM